MKIISSYSVEIRTKSIDFKPTIQIYRSALAFLIPVVYENWSAVSQIEGNQRQMLFVEHLIHTTKTYTAKYDFDVRFHKFPSYLRRAAINDTIGCVSSYVSNYENWVEGGKNGKEPKLQTARFAMPTFYKTVMYESNEENGSASLKLYINNDWVWVTVKLLQTDLKYIQKYWQHCKPSAPVLEKRHGKYYLRFAFEEKVPLSKTQLKDQRICAVDLGLNSDAVCSIMTSDETVPARKFFNFPSEKPHLGHLLNTIKKYQREHGSKNVMSFWQYAQRINDELTKKIASAITEFAVLYSVGYIVFEHLDFRGKKAKGSKKQRLQMWRKNGIQDMVEHKAHRCGIRISRICAWGTSKLAYDGSGIVERDKDNYALCTFAHADGKQGKQYNCDLSASYNIGARYFIRELLKPLPAMVRSDIEAKVPGCQRRTSNTLSTLRALTTALKAA